MNDSKSNQHFFASAGLHDGWMLTWFNVTMMHMKRTSVVNSDVDNLCQVVSLLPSECDALIYSRHFVRSSCQPGNRSCPWQLILHIITAVHPYFGFEPLPNDISCINNGLCWLSAIEVLAVICIQVAKSTGEWVCTRIPSHDGDPRSLLINQAVMAIVA
jgi:hypothetical protein